MRVPVDVGGTFTDVIVLDEASGDRRLERLDRVPVDPANGVLAGFAKAEVDLTTVDLFAHGTTLGINALIDGALGSYSVHLGSAVMHRQPGGALSIIPMHSQQRGRLFLPFADEDPKTAEVMSKVVLPARDDEIRDPSILERLRNP